MEEATFDKAAGFSGGAPKLQADEGKAAGFPLNLFNKKYIHNLIYTFMFTVKHKSFKLNFRKAPVDPGVDGQRYPG